jgi:putative hydrolase of the HAD superfamily
MSDFPADSSITVILFDVGGVLLTNGWDHRERAAVYAHFGLTAEEQSAIEARHPEPNDAWERDAISTRQYLDQVVFFTSRSFTREQFYSQMQSVSLPLQNGAQRTLQALAASKQVMAGHVVLGLLNNESRDLHEHRMAAYGIGALVRLQFSSCYLGLRKPDQAMYRRALDILSVPSQCVLFIDDREENVSAAREAGMHSIRFTGEAELEAALTEQGLL